MTIDMKLLKKQRQHLVRILDRPNIKNVMLIKDIEILDGLLNMLDLISDSLTDNGVCTLKPAVK